MDTALKLRTLLLACGLIAQTIQAVPQTPQPTSPTWQETMDWLGPAFNSSAHATTTSTCNGEPATTESEKATITRYDNSTMAVA
jgi:hypothetical protein